MMQPIILQKMQNKDQGISRQSGFFARSLISYPSSTMGERFYLEAPTEPLEALINFEQHITKILSGSLTLERKGCTPIPTLTLSSTAKRLWIQFFNKTESGLKQEKHWAAIKDFASKAAENVARLAALFHLFEGNLQNAVKSEHIEQSISIIQWHLQETKQIFTQQPLTPTNREAAKILDWLASKNITVTSTRYLQQYGPIREKMAINKAVDILLNKSYLKKQNADGKTLLLVNPKITKS